MPIIQVKNLKKNYYVYKKKAGIFGTVRSLVAREYEKVKAVDGISFNIEKGELLGFIGPNGAGKTTTLKCLSGLLYPDKGKISVLGFTPHERDNNFLKKISLVMGQKNQLWWDLPPMDTYVLNKEIYQIPDRQFNETINKLSELLNMKDLINIPVRKMSLGQRMKAELIAAVLHRPEVVFLDEPTIGLDVVMQKRIRDFIRRYNKEFCATIILTSHYMDDVAELCRRVIVIDSGKIGYDGSLHSLTKKYANYKQITVTLLEEVDRSKFMGIGEVSKYNYPVVKFRVPREKVKSSARKILDFLPVDDLNIEEAAIEDIIREIFSKND